MYLWPHAIANLMFYHHLTALKLNGRLQLTVSSHRPGHYLQNKHFKANGKFGHAAVFPSVTLTLSWNQAHLTLVTFCTYTNYLNTVRSNNTSFVVFGTIHYHRGFKIFERCDWSFSVQLFSCLYLLLVAPTAFIKAIVFLMCPNYLYHIWFYISLKPCAVTLAHGLTVWWTPNTWML